MVITFNYKDSAKTITFEEIENTINGSDLDGFGASSRKPTFTGLSGIFYAFSEVEFRCACLCSRAESERFEGGRSPTE